MGLFKKVQRTAQRFFRKSDITSGLFRKHRDMASKAYTNDIPEGYKLDSEISNRREKVYVDDNGKAIVSYRGTTLDRKDILRDLGADALLALGLQDHSSRFKKGVRTAKATIEKYGKDNVELTGHSLGGSVANYVSAKTGLQGSAYNPGIGLKNDYMNKSQIHNNVTITDPISTLHLAGGLHRGHVSVWKDKVGHGIDSK